MKGLSNFTLERLNASELPYENNFFDFVYSYGVIHHAPRYNGYAYQKIKRV